MSKAIISLLCIIFASFAVLAAIQKPELNKHEKFEIDCESCHADSEYKAAPASVCIDCHGGYPELSSLTVEYEPNPHAPHLMDLSCTECHRVHTKSLNFCEECHDTDFVVP